MKNFYQIIISEEFDFFNIYFLFEEINKNKYLQSFSQIEVVRAQQKVYFFIMVLKWCPVLNRQFFSQAGECENQTVIPVLCLVNVNRK